MRHGSLFTGVGGFDLAAHWMGWENVFQVEYNQDCQNTLESKFKTTKRHGDIRTFAGIEYIGTIDVLSGGFPCQSFSLAGQGGMDLSLWKEMFRVAKVIRPSWIVIENVLGLVVRKKGLALEVVCSDLEAENFTVLPPLVLPAGSAGAPHRRDRVWIIAYARDYGHQWEHREGGRQASASEIKTHEWKWIRSNTFGITESWRTSNADASRLSERVQPGRHCIQRPAKSFQGREFTRTYPKSDWSEFPTQSPLFVRDDGLPAKLDRRRRKIGIEGAGNAIVPQVAYEIFKAIDLIGNPTPIA